MKSEKISASGTQQRLALVDRDQIAEEVCGFMYRAAAPAVLGEQKCALINRAARRLDISYAKAKAYIYRERKRIAADEYLNIKAKLDALDQHAEYRKAVLDDLAQAHARARRVLQMESREARPGMPPLGALGQDTG